MVASLGHDTRHVAATAVYETDLTGLTRLHRGKVRDIYALDDEHMLIVTTDRLSAFDVVLPDPIPGKGRVLNEISRFWFARTGHIIPNHLTGLRAQRRCRDPAELAMLEGRAVIVRRLRALPIEAVVRGYLIGSGWKDYQASGSLCGIALPAGPAAGAGSCRRRSSRRPPRPPRASTMRTSRSRPSSKLIGAPLAAAVRDSRAGAVSLRVRARARARHHHRRHQIRIRPGCRRPR